MKITVIGAGYVGLSIAVLLSTQHEVIIADINKNKVESINRMNLLFLQNEKDELLQDTKLNLRATESFKNSIFDSIFMIICVPTNFNKEYGCFDTSIVESVIKEILSIHPSSTIIIKSTIPVGFTNQMRAKYNTNKIIFSPEFLREGFAIHDNLYPSRIILGDNSQEAKNFSEVLKNIANTNDIEVLFTGNNEAESIKLFSNTYLAMRVSFFNELDTFAETNSLNSADIIEGVCLDDRIGNHYNNPSFGYGGYCLPKDTQQLLSNYKLVPQTLIESTIKSNFTRKNHIARTIINTNTKNIGIYRLTMKTKSDNFRESAIFDIIDELKSSHCNIIIYEPLLSITEYLGCTVINNLSEFKERSELIVANRLHRDLKDVLNKVYTRDIFGNDQ
ncbi:nucleotide sugar dehydrogenase [Anaerorhabdus sp.]|uniref:nucleotide sugar dehydrogenase n=1 Tax=Anaerorhabdus sp. TaxID=1872524 RepID=UPI002FCBC497